MAKAFTLTIDEENIAHLLFDLPEEKVNTLSVSVLTELSELLDSLATNSSIQALILSSGKENSFVAGANLHEFEPMFKDPSQVRKMLNLGHSTFTKLENLPFPTIAHVHGTCLGGGLELALACTYRVATDHPKTQLGLPEVSLGIFPGWGGTKRLPKLVGLSQGLMMVLTGKAVNGYKAWKTHLADALFPWEFREEKLKAFVNDVLTKGKKILKRREPKGFKSLLLERNPLGRTLLFSQAKKQVLAKTKGHYPAPLVALELIKETHKLSLQKGLEKEVEAFVSNLPNAFGNAKHLVRLFFTQTALKSAYKEGTPKEVSSIGVLGAGIMGSEISWYMSYRDYPVRFRDISWEAVGKGYGTAQKIYSTLLKIRKLKPEQANLKFHNLSGTTDYSGFDKVDLVIEAAVENVELKQKIFKELEEVTKKETIIATNTSSFSITELAQTFTHPERFVGMHFFNPASRMPLVEVVAGEKSSQDAIATAVNFCRKIKKTPIVVKDCHGFLVNRVFAVSVNEIMYLLEQGIEMERLDRIILNFGMPMAPFVLADKVGNDVNAKVIASFEKAYGERMKVPSIVKAMDEQKLYGIKTKKGFYLYHGKKREKNPEVEKLLKLNQQKPPTLSDQEITERVFIAMINEAARCLEEKVVDNAATLDLALIMGIAFPPFRGGILSYADVLGITYVVDQLKRLQESVGSRFAPCNLLLDMQKKHQSFYETT